MIVVALGMLAGLGIVLIVAQLRPAQPDLDAALERLYSPTPMRVFTPTGEQNSLEERVGRWLESKPGLVSQLSIPTKRLRILQKSVASFVGAKVLMFALGLGLPIMVTTIARVGGVPLPWTLPAILAPVLGVALSFIPNLSLKAEAEQAQDQYNRALSSYIELVALQRKGGAGAEEALVAAAKSGEHPFFRRVQDTLAIARIQHIPAWTALEDLSNELELPALADVAELMRMSGEEGVGVYESLRERSGSLRSQILNQDIEAAADESQRMIIPGIVMLAVLGALFMVPRMMTLFST